MRVLRFVGVTFLVCAVLAPSAKCRAAQAHAPAGIEFTARVRPSEGQPEPVRGMTFYLLTRSLADLRKEAENAEGPVDSDHFIDQLGVSRELKEWMKVHRRLDLAGVRFLNELTAEDIVGVPELLSAYTRQNGAALHAVIPEPRYKKNEEQKNPEKYKRDREQYRQALRHYIQSNPDSVEGLDAELRDINPYPRWIGSQREHQRHIEQRVLELAQTRYLVASAVTDLSGRAGFADLAPGAYWLSNLDTPAFSGDLRLHWNVGITAWPAKTAQIELSDLNAVEASAPAAP